MLVVGCGDGDGAGGCQEAELRCNACACVRYSETDGSCEMETGSASGSDGVSFLATTLAADIAKAARGDIQYSLTSAPLDWDRGQKPGIPVITVTGVNYSLK